MRTVETDYSNGAECVLEIARYVDGLEKKVVFNASDEDRVSEYIRTNIGEQLNDMNGCPVYMEVPGWAYANAGADEEYSLYNYPGIDASEWKIELKHRS